MIEVNEEKQQHAPDISVRDTLDNGFSRGWGLHFLPNEEYWFDFHTHLAQTRSTAEIRQVMDEWFSILDGYRLARLTLFVDDVSLFTACKEIQAEDDRFSWFFFMNHHQPDLNLLDQAFACGAAGLKLHNAPIMKGQAGHEIWLGEEWRRIFERVEELRKPVLWHVTQRVSRSPYHGGSENAYWSENNTPPGDLDNETLLKDFLTIVRTYPDIPFVGAHQLHIGMDRLAALLDTHPNLHIDTSCGFFLRWADQLYETDKRKYQTFIQTYSDRILFGTDARLAPGQIDTYLVQSFLGHARFILQLQLPDDILQAVAWQNAEKLLGLKAKQVKRRGNVRP